jgi:ribonucleoside-triphosphate reductase
MDLLPKVSRTEGDLAEFDSSRILDSIIKETGMSEPNAKRITEIVVRRIISSGIKFLSGPHIREIVCSILSEQHFENERKLYTRIGIPLMDYEEILKQGLIEHPKRIINPEKIHNWAANRISEEYAHLRILTNEESKAHLYGDIHIHKLRYFDLRPLTQIWDPRIILEHGLPPTTNFISCCRLKPARNLKEAIHHLVQWLALTQNEFCGNQGFHCLSAFLSPYAKGMNNSDLRRSMKNLIYELNLLSVMTGRTISSTSIHSCPNIFEPILEASVVGNQGKAIEKYGNYQEECLSLFNGLVNAFKDGDDFKRPFTSPYHEIILNTTWLEDFNNAYQNVWDEINSKKTSILIKSDLSSLKEKYSKNRNITDFINTGVLQEICLNLPRVAYTTKDDTKFFELLNEQLTVAYQIFKKKYKIIENRLKSNHLPLCAGKINDKLLYSLENQIFSLSFIGLNEAAKFLTDYELHEHIDALNFGLKILQDINDICGKFYEESNLIILLSENITKKATYRFARLDIKHFPKIAIPQFKGDDPYYTNSFHFRADIEIDPLERVKKQEKLQYYIQNGAIEYISLRDLKRSNLDLGVFINEVFIPSKLERLKFV